MDELAWDLQIHTDIGFIVYGDELIAPVHRCWMRARPSSVSIRFARHRVRFGSCTYMIRLHMPRKSFDQNSMGPSGVDAQSTERANCICRGSEGDMGSRVQSKKPTS